MKSLTLVPKKEAFNGADCVVVDEDSEAHELWKQRGYVPGKPKAEAKTKPARGKGGSDKKEPAKPKPKAEAKAEAKSEEADPDAPPATKA